MSLRSVVKSKVRRSNSRESKKHRKKHRQSDGEDRGEDRSRSREEENVKDSPPPPRHPEKMRRKHSEDRSRSDGSVGRSARDSDQRDRNRRNRRERHDDSDERHSSGERRKDVKKDEVGEDRDRRRFQNDVDREDESEKSSDDEGERSKGRDDDRSRGDYDRDDERSRRDDRQYREDDKRSRKENERPSYKDDDRPKSVDERSHRDEYRSRQDDQRSRQDDKRSRKENELSNQDDVRSNRDDARSNRDDVRSKRDDVRSNRDDVQSHKDDKRSSKDDKRSSRDDDRSRQDDGRSNRNGSDSRSRRDEDRSKQRNDDRTRNDERRHDRDDERSEKRDDIHSKRDRTMDEKSKTNNAKEEDDGDNFLASKRAKASSADGAELVTRTGGAYIPPARLRMMQAQITDKSSAQYQRIAWEALKKSINGLINKINVSNLMMIVRELLQENIVRGRGVLVRSIMQAQAASPTFTHVYAALVAIINTKFPNIGELIVKRLIVSFKKGFKRNEKATCLSTLRFIAHLFNQLVCHEVLALQVLMLLVSQPTDDSVEVAVGFLKECGNKLKELAPKSLNAVFESLRTVLHEATIDKRVQYMIEVMFAIRKDGFKDHPSVIDELDIVEEDDQFTHDLKLDDPDLDPEDGLNVFKFDPQYLENEEKYKAIKKEHLDEGDSDDEDAEDGESGEGSDEDDDDDDEDGDDEEGKEKTVIIDNTETNLVAFRRTLYLTIQSSLDFEECAHKIRKMDIKPGQEDELCNMILDCCAQQRTYEKFFGLLAQRFCMMEKKFMEPYQRIFQEQYDTVHRLETNKLRNVAKFYAHLLYTDAIEWKVLECIRLNEDDTTSSGRIFIKILFQELSEYMGLSNLNDRLKDVTLQPHFEGLFPRDNPRNTRFAINFFTSIGLGGLTDELRDHLKSVPKQPVRSPTRVASASASSSSEDDSESSESDDSPSSSDSEPSPPVKKHRKGKASKTPEKKSNKSEERRKSERRSQKSEKSLNLTLTAKSSDGPTSMQLRLMKLASYSQLPENKDEEKLRGQVEKKRDEDTPQSHGRGQEVQHVKRNDDVQVRRRGQESESEDDDEKERRKGNRKADKDKREDKGHKRKRDEDSGSDRGQKQRTSKKRKEDSSSGSEGDRKGRPDRGEGRGRERSGERTKDRKRRHRSRS